MHSSLAEWQAAQHRVRELEQRLAMGMRPEVACREGIDVEQVKADLALARSAADRALQACLSEARRARRVHRSVGIHSGSSSLPGRSRT